MTIAAGTCAAALATGCTDPYAAGVPSTSTPGETATAATPNTLGEQPATTTPTTPTPQRSGGLGSTPEEALSRFASIYINWTAQTLADNLERLAAASVGDAASTMQRTAQESRGDYELHRSGVLNKGTVESVATQVRRRDTYVVVTRETTDATSGDYEGLRPEYHVTIAKVRQVADGWAVSSWLPQS